MALADPSQLPEIMANGRNHSTRKERREDKLPKVWKAKGKLEGAAVQASERFPQEGKDSKCRDDQVEFVTSPQSRPRPQRGFPCSVPGN